MLKSQPWACHQWVLSGERILTEGRSGICYFHNRELNCYALSCIKQEGSKYTEERTGIILTTWKNHLDKELFAKLKGYSHLSGESDVQTQFREQLQFFGRGLGV